MSDTNRRSKAYKDAMACVQFVISRRDSTLIATPSLDLRLVDAAGVDPFEVSRAAGLDLRALVVMAQINREAESYDQQVGYYNRHGWISSDDLSLMFRTLKVLNDGLDVLEDKYGPAAHFGQYIARVADILSIRSYVIEPFEGGAIAQNTTAVGTREAIEALGELVRKIAGERSSERLVGGMQAAS